MIKLPAITIIGNELLLETLQTLSPIGFKVFMYLAYRTQCYVEWGRGHDSEDLDNLQQELGLDYDQLVTGFIEVRQRGWLDAFVVAQHNPRYENNRHVEFWWDMDIWYDEDYKSSCWIEDREYPKSDYIDLVVGTKILQPPQTKEIKHRKNTKHWRMIRIKTLERDGYKCVDCEETKNLHVHHLTYENEGHENLEDLVTLCRQCHSKKKSVRN